MIYDIHAKPKTAKIISKVLDRDTKEEIHCVFFIDDKEGKEKAFIKRYDVDKYGRVLTNKEKTKVIIKEERRWVDIIRND